jgi:hypothetical protein
METKQRAKVGRKPISDKMVAVQIYRRHSHIKALGGMVQTREILNREMDRIVNKISKPKK